MAFFRANRFAKKKKAPEVLDEFDGKLGLPKKKENKMNAKRTEVDGIKFSSMWEAFAYEQFRDSENVAILALQPRFLLQPKFTAKDGEKVRAIEYVSDFRIVVDGKGEFIVDTKGHEDNVFKLKHKMFKYTHPEEVPLLIIHTKKELRQLISGV